MRPASLLLALVALGLLALALSRRGAQGVDELEPGGEPPPVAEGRELQAPPESSRESLRTSEQAEEAPAEEPRAWAALTDAIDSELGLFWRPEDPLELGPCVLELHLRDAESGDTLAGEVRLWRLGAPGNANWSAGDQLQSTLVVTEGGTECADLPAGEYRAVYLGAAAGADYSESFRVAGARTVHILRVHPPREIETFLELFDTNGERIEELELKRQGYSGFQVEPPAPDWLVERVTASEFFDLRGGGGGWGTDSHDAWQRLSAGPRGFALGSLLESLRTEQRSHRFSLRVPGRGQVGLIVTALPAPGGRLVAVFMDEADVLRHVILPDGRDALAAEASSSIRLQPVVVDAQRPSADWRQASIEVTVFREGATSWRRVWSPSEGPMTDRWMGDGEHAGR